MAYENVCKQSLLYEGELVPCKVGNQEIVIMWPDGGKPKAYEARCPHDNVSLARGDFNGRILYCIAHGWVFDGHNGKCLHPAGWAMKEYPMRMKRAWCRWILRAADTIYCFLRGAAIGGCELLENAKQSDNTSFMLPEIGH